MNHAEFLIGMEFETSAGRWRCTDVGTRTVVAIKISEVEVTTHIEGGIPTTRMEGAPDKSWFHGPPYAVAEHVFDEDGIQDCRKIPT